jgi:hypothetical protein
MARFPFLAFVVKHGAAAAAAVAVLAGLFVLAVLWPVWAAASLAPAPALVLGGLVLAVGRCFVELVVLITEMLLPHE